VAPDCCGVGKWSNKKLSYAGYHELAYLHPAHFTPEFSQVAELAASGPYFILRFASLTAHHDEGKSGITADIARRLVGLLSARGRVYITSERPLEPEFEPYRIRIAPSKMHHALAFASLYIGDSQTMAAEAAVLGTPCIRFNDFVGKIGYLRDLEERGLSVGIPSGAPDLLFKSAGRSTGRRCCGRRKIVRRFLRGCW
jgi:predicted glycosyltransferase